MDVLQNALRSDMRDAEEKLHGHSARPKGSPDFNAPT